MRVDGLGPRARAAIDHVRRHSLDGPPLDRSLRVTLNLHPDAPAGGETLLEVLARDGVYRSQFETGTSSGGLTAYPGGARWAWEERIFGGAYRDAPPGERPRYGALDHRRRPLGGAPRFGSAHLRLAEHVLDRTTFCFPDSVLEPSHFGTAEAFGLLPLVEAFASVARDDATERSEGGLLDDYVEAHVHGPVVVARDAEALVLDPCYRGTAVEEAAHRLGVPVEWHEGRVLTVAELERHPDFRGPEAVRLGREIADPHLDARIIGQHRRRGTAHPQLLKLVWHLVARFGSPAAEITLRRGPAG